MPHISSPPSSPIHPRYSASVPTRFALAPSQLSLTSPAIMSERQQGTIKWFNDEKGYGFVTPDEGADLFVHFRAIEGTGFRSLKEGQRVSFEVVQGQKGLQADKVRVEE
ncbi:hypothetical protein V2G26_017116 [Clonostachys chloroleuca]